MLQRIGKVLAALSADDCGANAIEYAMIAALIVLVLIAAIASIGGSVSGYFASAGADL